jgi:hypothetical protein
LFTDSTDGLVVSGGLDGNVKTSDGVEFPSKLVVVRSISINSKDKKIAVGGPDGQISVSYEISQAIYRVCFINQLDFLIIFFKNRTIMREIVNIVNI